MSNHSTNPSWSMKTAWSRNVSLSPREALIHLSKALALLPPDEEESADFLLRLLRFVEESAHEEPV